MRYVESARKSPLGPASSGVASLVLAGIHWHSPRNATQKRVACGNDALYA